MLNFNNNEMKENTPPPPLPKKEVKYIHYTGKLCPNPKGEGNLSPKFCLRSELLHP